MERVLDGKLAVRRTSKIRWILRWVERAEARLQPPWPAFEEDVQVALVFERVPISGRFSMLVMQIGWNICT